MYDLLHTLHDLCHHLLIHGVPQRPPHGFDLTLLPNAHQIPFRIVAVHKELLSVSALGIIEGATVTADAILDGSAAYAADAGEPFACGLVASGNRIGVRDLCSGLVMMVAIRSG